MSESKSFHSPMPQVGFGLWKIDRDKTADMVTAAIAAGATGSVDCVHAVSPQASSTAVVRPVGILFIE